MGAKAAPAASQSAAATDARYEEGAKTIKSCAPFGLLFPRRRPARPYYIFFAQTNLLYDFAVAALQVLLIPPVHLSRGLGLRAGCPQPDHEQPARSGLVLQHEQHADARPAMFFGSFDQAVVRGFPCSASTFGRALYTFLWLYPLHFDAIMQYEYSEPMYATSLLAFLSYACLSAATASVAAGSAASAPASLALPCTRARRLAIARHCMVAAVRLSIHGGILLSVVDTWHRYGKQAGAMLLPLGAGKYYMSGHRHQVCLFGLMVDVGTLKLPMELQLPLSVLQLAIGVATAVLCDLMTHGSLQQPFQTVLLLVCCMVVVPAVLLYVWEQPLRMAYFRDGAAAAATTETRPSAARTPPAATAPGSSATAHQRPAECNCARAAVQEPRNASSGTLPCGCFACDEIEGAGSGSESEDKVPGACVAAESEQSCGSTNGLGGTAAVSIATAVAGSDGADADAGSDLGVAARRRFRDGLFSEYAGTSGSNCTLLSDGTGGGGVTALASMSISGLRPSVPQGAPETFNGALQPTPFTSCYCHGGGGSSTATGSCCSISLPSEDCELPAPPELYAKRSSWISSDADGHDRKDGVGGPANPRVIVSAPCYSGTARTPLGRAAPPEVISMSATATGAGVYDGSNRSAGHSPVICAADATGASSAFVGPRSVPRAAGQEPRRPTLDLRLLSPELACGPAAVRHGNAATRAAHAGAGAAAAASGSHAIGSDVLYTSRLGSCAVSVKVGGRHPAAGGPFPQAAAALSAAAGGALRSFNMSALSAALRAASADATSAAGGVGVSGSGGRGGGRGSLLRAMGSGVVVRGCLHLIHVVRFPRSVLTVGDAPRRRLLLTAGGTADANRAADAAATATAEITPGAAPSKAIPTADGAPEEVGPAAVTGPGAAAGLQQHQYHGRDGGEDPRVAAGGAIPHALLGLVRLSCNDTLYSGHGGYLDASLDGGGGSSGDEAGHASPFVSCERQAILPPSGAGSGGNSIPNMGSDIGGRHAAAGARLVHIELTSGSSGGAGGGIAATAAAVGRTAVPPRSRSLQLPAVRDALTGPLQRAAVASGDGVVGVVGGLGWQPLSNFISVVVEPQCGSCSSGGADGFRCSYSCNFALSSPFGAGGPAAQEREPQLGGGSSCSGVAAEGQSIRLPFDGTASVGTLEAAAAGPPVGIEPWKQRPKTAVAGLEAHLSAKHGCGGPSAATVAAAACRSGQCGETTDHGAADLGQTLDLDSGLNSGSDQDLQAALTRAYEQAVAVAAQTAADDAATACEVSSRAGGAAVGRWAADNGNAAANAVSAGGARHIHAGSSENVYGSCTGGNGLLPCYPDVIAVTPPPPTPSIQLIDDVSPRLSAAVHVVLSPEAVAALAELQQPPCGIGGISGTGVQADAAVGVCAAVSHLRVRVVVARASGSSSSGGGGGGDGASAAPLLDEPLVPLKPLLLPQGAMPTPPCRSGSGGRRRNLFGKPEQQHAVAAAVARDGGSIATWPAAYVEVGLPVANLLREAPEGAAAVFVYLLAPQEPATGDDDDDDGNDGQQRSQHIVQLPYDNTYARSPGVPDRRIAQPRSLPTRGSESSPPPPSQQREHQLEGDRGNRAWVAPEPGFGPSPGPFSPRSTAEPLPPRLQPSASRNRLLAALPLLLVAAPAVAEELRAAYDEHAAAISYNSGDEEMQPHLPYSISRLVAYRDHIYDLVADVADLLVPPPPALPPFVPGAEAGEADAPTAVPAVLGDWDNELAAAAAAGANDGTEREADLAAAGAMATGEQLLSYMCGRGMWFSARLVVQALQGRWGVEVVGAEALLVRGGGGGSGGGACGGGNVGNRSIAAEAAVVEAVEASTAACTPGPARAVDTISEGPATPSRAALAAAAVSEILEAVRGMPSEAARPPGGRDAGGQCDGGGTAAAAAAVGELAMIHEVGAGLPPTKQVAGRGAGSSGSRGDGGGAAGTCRGGGGGEKGSLINDGDKSGGDEAAFRGCGSGCGCGNGDLPRAAGVNGTMLAWRVSLIKFLIVSAYVVLTQRGGQLRGLAEQQPQQLVGRLFRLLVAAAMLPLSSPAGHAFRADLIPLALLLAGRPQAHSQARALDPVSTLVAAPASGGSQGGAAVPGAAECGLKLLLPLLLLLAALQLLTEPGFLLSRLHPLALEALLALHAVSYFVVAVHWLGLSGVTAAAHCAAAALLALSAAAHWWRGHGCGCETGGGGGGGAVAPIGAGLWQWPTGQ